MMKTRNPNLKMSKVSIALLMLLSLEGCEVPNKQEIPMPEKPYILKHDTKLYTVHFHGRNSKLSEPERVRLLAAIKPSGPGKMSTHVTIPNKGSRLDKQRLKNLIRTLLESGVKAKQIHKNDKLSKASGNSIEIVLDTYHAIPPLCPNWSTQYGSGYSRGQTGNFGCATAANFLLMLDDPIILFKGEQSVSRDAARDSLAIADHRAGKDKGKWLKVEKSEGAGGSSGSASGGGQ
ncbi:MAG: hypothetical protein FJX03_02790 [Alphaproteobacteria bacterium]|nr:hypothetical protein [Alphaproteobacteria bacterium]